MDLKTFTKRAVKEDDILVMYNSDDFELCGDRIHIDEGDKISIETVNGKTFITLVAFGTVPGDLTMNVFYKVHPFYETFYCMPMHSFIVILRNCESYVQMVLMEEFNKFYYDRPTNLVKPIEREVLKDALIGLNCIKIRGDKAQTKKRFALTEEQIGKPDWIVKFKVNTSGGSGVLSGMTSLAKIASVVQDHKHNLFLNCHNHRGTETYLNGSTVFYSLSGINLSPLKVAEKILQFDKK